MEDDIEMDLPMLVSGVERLIGHARSVQVGLQGKEGNLARANVGEAIRSLLGAKGSLEEAQLYTVEPYPRKPRTVWYDECEGDYRGGTCTCSACLRNR